MIFSSLFRHHQPLAAEAKYFAAEFEVGTATAGVVPAAEAAG